MSPYIGYDSDTTFIPGTLNTSSSLTIQGGGITQTGGDVNFDSGTLFIDEDLNRVGIGITTPARALDVYSNNSTDIVKFSNDSGTSITLGTFAGMSTWDVPASTGFRIRSGGSSGEYLTISSTGNVGIGDSTPGVKLEVVGTTTSGLRIKSAENNSRGLELWNDGINDICYISNYYSGPLILQTANIERLRITSSGNVGIGTTNPLKKIHILGGTSSGYSITNTEDRFILARFESEDARVQIASDNAGSNGSSLILSNDDYHWIVDSKAVDANNRFSIGYYNSNTSDTDDWNQNKSDYLTILTTGNVGIGTDNPTSKLHVNGGVLVKGPTTPNINLSPLSGGSGNADISFDGNDLKIVSNSSSANVRINAYSRSNDFVLKQDGKIGIGTDTPTVDIELNKSASSVRQLIKNTLTTGYAALSVGADTGTLHIGFRGDSYANTYGVVGPGMGYIDGSIDNLGIQTVGNILFGTGTSTANIGEKVRITSTGNVGIGITNPTQKLEVYEGNLYLNKPTGDPKIFAPNGVGLNIDGQALYLNRYTNSTIAMALGGGNVGINTISPSEKLEIYGGDILLSNNAIGVNNGTGPNNQIRFEYNGHNYARIVGNGRDSSGYGDIDFYTSSGDGVTNLEQRMTIRDDGKVGIGTTEPNSALSIMTNQDYSTNGVEFDNYASLYLVNDYRGGAYTYSESVIVLAGRSSGGSTHRNSVTGGGSGISFFTTLNTDLLDTPDLRITRSGNVGIGTTNPTNKFHIYQAADDYLLYGSNPRLFLQTPTGTNGLRIFSTTTPFEVGGSASTRRISIGSDPNYDISISGKYSGTANDSSPKLFLNTTWYNGSANLTSFQGTIHSVSTSNAADAGYLGLGSNANGNHLVIQAGTGNVGIGSTDPQYKLEVNGSFAATTKSFIIPHPTKPGYKLRHGSLEGPENGVYVRGRSNSKVIELPDYWVALVDPDSITVTLTPIGQSGVPRVERIENNKVYVFTEDSRPLEYFYVINAERIDVEPLEVEIPPTN